MTVAAESNIRKRVTPSGWAALYFAILAIAVWTPSLFQNGYVLLGDMVFTPAMHSPVSMLGPVRGTMDIALVYNLAWLVSRVIGAVLLQKAALFLLAFLPGYLMYRNVPATRQWSRLLAGTLYAINPFVYTRMVMGQWGFLLGYALLPVVFTSTLKTARRPTAGRCAVTALWLAGAAALSLHAGALALMVAAVVVVFEMAKRPRAARTVLAGLVVLVLFLLLSSFWLLPAVDGGGPGSTMTRADLKVFETRSTSRAGTALTVAGLYGFWKTQIDGLMPRRYIPLWPAFGILMTVFCLYGLFRYHSEPGRGPELLALATLAVTAFFLSLGARAPVTGGLFSFAFDHISAFRLFREPQKFVALIVLAYAMLGASGLDRVLSRRHQRERPPAAARRARAVIPVVLLALICLYSFRMFGGLWGQAKAVTYPRSWSAVKETLDRDCGDWSALYLPPYWYMRFDFTHSDYTITNPMPLYFTNRSLPRTSIEVGPFKLDRQPLDRYVDAALESGKQRGNLGAMLAPLSVKYVVLARNPASVNFRFVEKQKDLEVVRDLGDIVLLRNKAPSDRLTLVNSSGTFTTLASLARKASDGVLLGSKMTRGTKTVVPRTNGIAVVHTASGGNALSARALPDGHLAGKKTLLFGDSFSPYWNMNGSAPSVNLDTTMTFSAVPKGSIKITYSNPWLIVGYCLSGAGLILCAILILAGSIRGYPRRSRVIGQKSEQQSGKRTPR